MKGGASADGDAAPTRTPFWRRCEIAWGAALSASGLTVLPLADQVRNSSGTDAPMIHLPNGQGMVPAPDFQSVSPGNVQYWEVKSRLAPSTDPLTGVRRHSMSHASFIGYLRLSEISGVPVNVVLHERGTASEPPRWLKIRVQEILAHGTRTTELNAAAQEVDVIAWPVDVMDVVDGPRVDATDREVPILPGAPTSDATFDASIGLYERALRKPISRVSEASSLRSDSTPSEDRNIAYAAAAKNPLRRNRLAALEVLRRKLGIPATPRYSVLRVGSVDSDLLGLLEYGIRVFLVTNRPYESPLAPDRVASFRESRLLESVIVPDLEPAQETWQVDGGAAGPRPAWLDDVLSRAGELGGFNLQQYSIVHAPSESDVLVTAGAGTGKTETMSERLVFLLATLRDIATDGGERQPHDLRLQEIGLVTFTNESASEMRSRIGRTIARRQRLCPLCVLPTTAWLSQLGQANISTIHSFAKRVVQLAGARVGLSPDLRVSNGSRTLDELIGHALSPHLEPLFAAKGDKIAPIHEWMKHIRSVWEALQNNGIRLLTLEADGKDDGEDCIDWGVTDQPAEPSSIVRTVVEQVRRRFSTECRRYQYLPTGQLVPTAVKSLRAAERSSLLGLRFLFVDEFQDTDTEQMEMLLEIRDRFAVHLFLVGDAKQGVYRFRGAEGNAFGELVRRIKHRSLPKLREFSLTRNFRSGKALLGSLHPYFARWGENDLLSYTDVDRLSHDPDRMRASKSLSTVVVSRNSFAKEAAVIVARWRTESPIDSIAVLCRQNWQAIDVQRELERRGLPCDLLVGGSFFQSPAVVETRALLEATLDPDDDAALLELLQTRWGVGLCARDTAPHGCDDVSAWTHSVSPLRDWRQRFVSVSEEGHFKRCDLDAARRRLTSLGSLARKMSALAFVVSSDRALDPRRQYSIGDDHTEQRRYARCLDHLFTLMDTQFAESPATLVSVLEWLKRQIAINHLEDEPHRDEMAPGEITALTVHKSKGQEFDRVLIANTWTPFGPSKNIRTSTAILREQDDNRIIWKWRPGKGSQYSNLAPAEQTLWDIDEKEIQREETRLLYVAMTRARCELRILVPNAVKEGTWSSLLKPS